MSPVSLSIPFSCEKGRRALFPHPLLTFSVFEGAVEQIQIPVFCGALFWGVKPPLFHSWLQITLPAKTAAALSLSSKTLKVTLKSDFACVAPQQDGDKFWRMPECYIRGSTIKYLRIPDEIIDMVKEEVVSKGRGRGGMQQQKQQKGRGVGGAGRGKKSYFYPIFYAIFIVFLILFLSYFYPI